MKTKLNELLEFPCPFTYKVMGIAEPQLVNQVVEVVQRHAPGDYTPEVKPSSKGNYHSVSITITATHIDQVEMLYEELGNLELVRMVL
ncbi:TPA: YbeD family protein [Yersinia enterocolitica]|nr:YbeD family protein [Yersinia enterocolitica]